MALQNNPNATGLKDLNAPGSRYASRQNRAISDKVERITRRQLFDAQPKQFLELTLLNMNQAKETNLSSDEISFGEYGWQRAPLFVTSTGTSGYTQTVSVSNMSEAAENHFYLHPSGVPMLLHTKNEAAGTVTFKAIEGETLPQIVSDSILANQGPIEADGTDSFASYFRMDIIERDNYVQFFSRGRLYGEIEYEKLSRAGRWTNFLQEELKQLMLQGRIDLSNTFWTGKKGEVVLPGGLVAKSMNGVYQSMKEAGSPEIQTTKATVVPAFEHLVEQTEYGQYGATRFFFAHPKVLKLISNAYKGDKTRYAPNDMVAKLMLNQIDIGSSVVVLVPYGRFGDRSSFPAFYANSGFLLDFDNIKMGEFFAPQMYQGLADERGNGGKKMKKEIGMSASLTLFHYNPLSCGRLEVTDLS